MLGAGSGMETGASSLARAARRPKESDTFLYTEGVEGADFVHSVPSPTATPTHAPSLRPSFSFQRRTAAANPSQRHHTISVAQRSYSSSSAL